MPMSNTQIDRLGDRLRKSDSPSEEDLTTYQDMCERYGEPLNGAVEALERCGFVVTTRYPKTAGTLIEKLKRDRSRLSTVQDIAGARVVIDGDRDAQDEAVRCLVSELDGLAICVVVDRREEPSAGYRAVHVIARFDGVPVEIQIRTSLQDGWANMMEKFADLHGRQVRYGEPPTDPEEPIDGREDRTPATLHRFLLELTDLIDDVEDSRSKLNNLESLTAEELAEVLDAFEIEGPLDDLSKVSIARQSMSDHMQDYEGRLQDVLETFGRILESVGR